MLHLQKDSLTLHPVCGQHLPTTLLMCVVNDFVGRDGGILDMELGLVLV